MTATQTPPLHPHPLAQLALAGTSMLSAIEAATATLEALGTSSLDEALARLQAAAIAAGDRIARAGQAVEAMTREVRDEIQVEANRINSALAWLANPTSHPAPVPAPAPSPFDDLDGAEESFDLGAAAGPTTADTMPVAVAEFPAGAQDLANRATTPAVALGHHLPIEKYPTNGHAPADGPGLFDAHAITTPPAKPVDECERDDRIIPALEPSARGKRKPRGRKARA